MLVLKTPFNPMNPYDALKHHFKFLETGILLQLGVQNANFQETSLPIHGRFL